MELSEQHVAGDKNTFNIGLVAQHFITQAFINQLGIAPSASGGFKHDHGNRQKRENGRPQCIYMKSCILSLVPFARIGVILG